MMAAIRNEPIQDERWLPVVGYEGIYDVSDHGRVRRMRPGPSTYIGKILSLRHNGPGYTIVGLCRDGSPRAHKLHRLVAAAFLGVCPDGKEVNHKDGIKAHNAATNLEYITRSENMLHAFRNGLKAVLHGEAIGNAKLTEENVHEIRRRLLAKESQTSIGRRFNVSRQTIGYIATGTTWAWLKEI